MLDESDPYNPFKTTPLFSLSNNAIAKLKSLPTFWNALYLTNPVFWIHDPISLSNLI